MLSLQRLFVLAAPSAEEALISATNDHPDIALGEVDPFGLVVMDWNEQICQ